VALKVGGAKNLIVVFDNFHALG